MLHHWLLITFSWLGTVRPQYINSAGPSGEFVLDTLDTNLPFPLPYLFNSLATSNDFETSQDNTQNSFEDSQAYLQRRRRTTEDHSWLPNQIDIDRSMNLQNQEQIGSSFINTFDGVVDENATKFLDAKEKKYFSPWGGKRDKNSIENMYTWKRASNIREPSMPKRVRFSPWGGKRSGQIIYKPGSKNSKIIFAASIPDLTRLVSAYSRRNGNQRLNFAGFQFIPILDKRHPIKILALSTNTNERTLRDSLPFKNFLASLPKMFKPGHPYLDVHLKKDGKRKVKFSAWGGKRSPPLIGPIWTPAPQDIKDTTLDTILLLRNIHNNKGDPTIKAL